MIVRPTSADAALRRAHREDRARARLRLRELQGEVPAPPHRRAHARARRAHVRATTRACSTATRREYERLLDALTINVTKLFRNWDDLRGDRASSVVPALWALPRSRSQRVERGLLVRRGAVLARGAVPRPRRRRSARPPTAERACSVLGTDIDARCLDAAARGAVRGERLRRHAGRAAPALLRARAAVHDRARGAPHGALRAARPARRGAAAGPHHLICCRNVLIYFDRETQERLFERFHDALAPDGFLVLGKVETLLGAARDPVRGRGRRASASSGRCDAAILARRPRRRSPTTRSRRGERRHRHDRPRLVRRDRAVRRGRRASAGSRTSCCRACRCRARRRTRAKFPRDDRADACSREMRAARRARRRASARRSSAARACSASSSPAPASTWASATSSRRARRSRPPGSRSSPRTRGCDYGRSVYFHLARRPRARCGRSRRETVSSRRVADRARRRRQRLHAASSSARSSTGRASSASWARRATGYDALRADPRARAGHRHARRRDAGARRPADARLHHERDAARRW